MPFATTTRRCGLEPSTSSECERASLALGASLDRPPADVHLGGQSGRAAAAWCASSTASDAMRNEWIIGRPGKDSSCPMLIFHSSVSIHYLVFLLLQY